MLDYIKNNFSKQSVQNEAAAEKIRSHLKDYNAKLKDLEEALEEARNLVKKANTQNGLNAQTLKNLEVIKQQFIHACSLIAIMNNHHQHSFNCHLQWYFADIVLDS